MSLISAENIVRIYHDAPVLNGVSIAVNPGESVVLMGPSGAGKSTALRCMAGLEPLQGGRVVFDGDVLVGQEQKPRSSNGEIGMVFQQFNLFPHLTAEQNVALAPRRVRGASADESTQAARDLLKQVGLDHHYAHYPAEMSGGQQQRVAIARALAMKPKVMLFDEPTSSLDPEYTREVLDVMRELAVGGLTTVVVTHEMGFARRSADRVVFIDDGCVIEEGTTEQVFTDAQHERTRRFLQRTLSD